MTADEMRARLAAPFHPDEIGWKPQSVKGNRALAVAYIDARTVEDRLDDVFGVGGWQDEFTPLDGGNMMCRLSVLVDGRWVVKCDVGGESEQPDGGDRTKAAVSDALKRAAVKLGVGRYLYDLPKQWCDFDPQTKRFTQTPQLPAKFLPQPTSRHARKANPEAGPLADARKANPEAGPLADARKAIAAAADLLGLRTVWDGLPGSVQERLAADKERRKAELTRPAGAKPQPTLAGMDGGPTRLPD